MSEYKRTMHRAAVSLWLAGLAFEVIGATIFAGAAGFFCSVGVIFLTAAYFGEIAYRDQRGSR